MSQNTEPGPTGWVKFEEPGSGSPNRNLSPSKRSPTSSGVSSARGSVNSLAVAEATVVNGQVISEQPGALSVSEIQVINALLKL